MEHILNTYVEKEKYRNKFITFLPDMQMKEQQNTNNLQIKKKPFKHKKSDKMLRTIDFQIKKIVTGLILFLQ